MKPEAIDTTEVPTLHSVVRSGDPAVIHSTRQTHELANELDQNLGPDLSREIFQSLMQHNEQGGSPEPFQANFVAIDEDQATESGDDPDDPLEIMIDDIVDRHITALRHDIRVLLQRALSER